MKARQIAHQLKTNNDLYRQCSDTAQAMFDKYYHEDVFKSHITQLIEDIVNENNK